jgi:hypothetical protein
MLGFRGQPLWLMIKVLRFAQRKEKWKLLKAILRWTFAKL